MASLLDLDANVLDAILRRLRLQDLQAHLCRTLLGWQLPAG